MYPIQEILRRLSSLESETSGKGGGGSGLVTDFTFRLGAANVSPVFGTWAALYAAISTLPAGVSYRVTQESNAVVPVGVWNLRGNANKWRSSQPATGTFTLTIPDGAVIDNPPQLIEGILWSFAPTAADAITFSASPPGTVPRVLEVANGAALNNLGTHALNTTPGIAGPPTFSVLALGLDSIRSVPPSTAPIFFGGGVPDVILCAQEFSSQGPPDGWVAGTAANLVYFMGAASGTPPIPGWLGPAPVLMLMAKAPNIAFAPAVPGNWSPTPAEVAAALDQLAARPAAGAPLSPLKLMHAIAASGIDAFAPVAGGFTVACSFMVSDTVTPRRCAGGVAYWGGVATTIRIRLWEWTNVGVAVSVASVDVPVAGAGDVVGVFGASVALTPGVVYSISAWDTSNTQAWNIGANNANSPTANALKEPSIASGFLVFCLPPGNGGGALGPCASYGNPGDMQPGNVSNTGFSPVEPTFV